MCILLLDSMVSNIKDTEIIVFALKNFSEERNPILHLSKPVFS